MSTAPAFQTADKLSEPCSVSDEIAKALRVRDEAILKLTNPTEQTHDVNPTFKQSGANIRPEEKQALVQLLSDLGEQGKSQAKQIKGLQTVTKDQAEQIGLLRDGIVRLLGQLEDLEARIGLDIALDRQRIKKLEFPEHIQPKQKDRADTLRLLLAANNGKMLAKDARHRLDLSESQFSQLLKTLKGLVEVRPLHTDGRQNVITLVKALTNDGA